MVSTFFDPFTSARSYARSFGNSVTLLQIILTVQQGLSFRVLKMREEKRARTSNSSVQGFLPNQS